MYSKSSLKTIAGMLIVLAVIYRITPAKEVLTGETKFLGWF